MRTSTPSWLLWTVLVGVAGGLMVFGVEIMLRIVPGDWTSSFFYVYDPLVGTWHLSNYTGDNRNRDYTIRGIHFNSFGARDRERSIEKAPGITRVAVLGDSFVEGAQVANDQVLTARMEELLGEKFEVMNFGVAGFGTAQEYLTYVERVRPFKPDIVILGFLSSNDMRNNSRALETLANGGDVREMPFWEKQEDGSWGMSPTSPKPSAELPVIHFLKRHFVLYRFLWLRKEGLRSIFTRAPIESATTTAEHAEGERTDVYMARLFAPPEGEADVFKEAWQATDQLLLKLYDAVRSDGAAFVVVALPDTVHIDPDPRTRLEEEYGEKLPPSYDVDYPEKHLGTLARDVGFHYLDLTPEFRMYRDQHELAHPYFSYEHDGHWTKLGHALAADTIVSYLKEKGLVP